MNNYLLSNKTIWDFADVWDSCENVKAKTKMEDERI